MKISSNIYTWVQRHKYELWLVTIILLVFWPFTFQIYIPKWDNLDGYLPYRYTVSDFIQNGKLPLWSPYTYLGTPTYADLQSGAWTPFVWLVSLFGHYGIGALIVELLLCYVIAGLGMFRLIDYLVQQKAVAFIVALSYGLSGFMVGSSQLMVFLIGIAWLPWIFYFLLQLLRAPNVKTMIWLSLCIAIHTSSASPAYTILLVYFIFFFLVWYFFTKRGQSYAYINTIKYLFAALGLSVILLLPYLISFYEFSPYFNRIERLSLDRFLINPFTTKEYISFIWPYSTVANTDIFSNTSLTLRNGYFGIIGLIGALTSIFVLKRSLVIPAYLGIILSLILASGAESGLYNYFVHLPGIGLFRHPSIYKTYTIFIGLILCGLTLKKLLEIGRLALFLKYLGAGLVLSGSITLFILFFQVHPTDLFKVIQDVFDFKEFSDFGVGVHIAMNSLLWIIIPLVLYLLHRIYQINLLRLAVIGTVLELAILSYWIAPTTVYNKIPAENVAQFIHTLPKEPSQAFNQTPLQLLEENKDMETTHGLWRNLSMFHKRPAKNGCNPLRFKRYDEALNNETLNDALEHPIVYVKDEPGTPLQSIIGRNSFSVQYVNETNRTLTLVLNQNYHHLWKAYINNKEVPVFLFNDLVMGVDLPIGSANTVEFKFESSNTIVAALVALIAYLSSMTYLLIKRKD